jgi:uncharacterized membrane protein YphA (DoxX/SURF4 family)
MSNTQAATVPHSVVPASTGRPLRIALWTVQGLLAVIFCLSGFTKLATPVTELAAMMPWAGQVSPAFVRFIGLVDLAGGVGILLPALTRIQPRLTVLAALGCVVLQVLAFGFHAFRGEFSVLPVNIVLLALSAFVLWGRSTKVQVAQPG